MRGGDKGPSAIAREIGDVNPTQISGLLRQLASEGVVARTAGGKWQLSAATQHEQSPAASAEPPAGNGGSAEPSEPVPAS